MKFSVEQKTINRQLSFVAAAIPSRNTISAYSNIKCIVRDRVLYMEAGDGINSRFAKCEVHSDANIEFCADGNVSSIVSLSAGVLEFTLLKSRLKIKSQNGEYEVPTIETDLYPSHVDDSSEVVYEGDADSFIQAISNVEHMVYKSDDRPQFNGIHISGENNEAVSTNGNGICIYNIESSHNTNVTIPADVISALKQLKGSVVIKKSDTVISVKGESQKVVGRLSGANFPNYSVFKDIRNSIKAVVDANDLIASLKMMSACSGDNHTVTLDFTEKLLSLQASDVMMGISGTENIVCESTGNVKITFSGKTLSAAVNKYKDMELIIELESYDKPVVMGANSRLTTILAPTVI